ncbi:MAG: S9 family peptidase [Planctomycetes bacterium]|nr:S9 family peptidase [Planctomycetota bacterium]
MSPKDVVDSPLWRRDSKAFAYRSNETSSADFHIYVHYVENRQAGKVYEAAGDNTPVDFNRDGSKLMVMKETSASFTQLFEITLATKEAREITPKGEEWSFEPIGYSDDDKSFLVNTDYKADLKQIHTIDLKSGKVTPVMSDLAGREIDGGVLNEGRTVLAVIVNEDGYATLQLRSAKDFSPMPSPTIAKGVVGNVRFQGNFLLYSIDNANTPGLIYKWDMNKSKEPAVALTTADTQGVDVSKFRLPELVHYESFDGLKIPAFMYLPSDYQKGAKIPFIVSYHGGPEAQYRPNFNRSFQYFLSKGFGVVAPNPRGSSGYGKKFLEADNYKNRDKSVKDGIWAAKYVIDQGFTDKKMVAAWGGSYGGFMTMAVITEAPEYYGAACDVVGIVNFQTFLEKTKDYRRKLREVEYGPLSDPEFLKSISPIYKADRIDMPLMIAHGLNDPRVPIGEAMQIAVALKQRGVDVEELYFPDEGHGFAKEANRLLYYEQMAKFFERNLLDRTKLKESTKTQ